jgi:hypothetical protein
MSDVADLYYPQPPMSPTHVPLTQMQGLVMPNPTPDFMSGLGLGGLLDPIFGVFEQRILGIPVWAIGLGIGAYFMFKPSSKAKKAWEDA